MADEVKLFAIAISPFVCRVKLALNMKGIKYQNLEEDFPNRSTQLLRYNPLHKKVPVLVHNGNPISESLVIVEYIDDVWKQVPIFPQDPYQKAVARFWVKFIDEKCIPALHNVFGNNGGEQVVAEACENLQVLENEVGVKGKRFFGGDNMDIVDIVAGFIAYWLGLMEEATQIKIFTEDKFPKLTKWSDEFVNCQVVKEILPPRSLEILPPRSLVLAYYKKRFSKG
ncbi:probable glutathione S-transferase [Cynara cardunculus var. scolymus]|uniref:probable glutathione S-transferase n=1 Tax=Cynara cardunculus var. scolymus TaxID=59895 RepID=UPI000D624B88|nr:probable glutathione S-transferase [Cynara cardunculus var. scolymus]